MTDGFEKIVLITRRVQKIKGIFVFWKKPCLVNMEGGGYSTLFLTNISWTSNEVRAFNK